MTAQEDRAFIGLGNHEIGHLTARLFPSGGAIAGVVDLAPHVTVFCYSGAQARQIAQAFGELAGLLEQREQGLPPMAPEPSAGCDGVHPDGVLLCTATAGHEPLDHACYDPDGVIVARWPSVRPAGGEQ